MNESCCLDFTQQIKCFYRPFFLFPFSFFLLLVCVPCISEASILFQRSSRGRNPKKEIKIWRYGRPARHSPLARWVSFDLPSGCSPGKRWALPLLDLGRREDMGCILGPSLPTWLESADIAFFCVLESRLPFAFCNIARFRAWTKSKPMVEVVFMFCLSACFVSEPFRRL